VIEIVSSPGWTLMNVGFLLPDFRGSHQIDPGADTGMGPVRKFFLFLATTWFIQLASSPSVLHAQRAEEFSELIRTGGLDFALLQTDRYSFS